MSKKATEKSAKAQDVADPSPIKFEEVKCRVETLNGILDYLGRRPYSEVSGLIQAIQTGFAPIPLPEKAVRKVGTKKDK